MSLSTSINDKQKEMIARCKKPGYGWSKFASSVESSGTCSFAQEETLYRMVQRIDSVEQRKFRYGHNQTCHDISDEEAAVTSFNLKEFLNVFFMVKIYPSKSNMATTS